jgi:hypothetical protein
VQANGTPIRLCVLQYTERVHANAERGLQSGERVHANAERGLQSSERVQSNAERGLQSGAYTQTRVSASAYTHAERAETRSAPRIFRTPSLRFPLPAGGTEPPLVPLAKRGNAGTPAHGSPREAGGT